MTTHCPTCDAPAVRVPYLATDRPHHEMHTVRFDLRAALQERIAGISVERLDKFLIPGHVTLEGWRAALLDLLTEPT